MFPTSLCAAGPGQPMPSNQGRGPSSMNLPPPAPAEPGDPFAGATCVVPMWNKQEPIQICKVSQGPIGMTTSMEFAWIWLNLFRGCSMLRAGQVFVCVCESNSVPKRSKLLFLESQWCYRRGTQEAHRAVSNEALYGVFRISGLITLTYLHLWNCWQVVFLSVFPSIRTKNLSPTIHLPVSC